MKKQLAAAILGLLLLAGAAPVAAEPPSVHDHTRLAVKLIPRADRQPSLRVRATRQRFFLLPEHFPRVEVNLEKSPYVRRGTLTLKKFWDGKLRLEVFRQVERDPFYVFTSAPRVERVPRARKSYGFGFRFTF